MKVLLANPPWKLEAGSVYSRTGAVYPPLGLASMAAVLERDSAHEVVILDAWALGMDLRAFGEAVRLCAPDVLGLTAYTTTVQQALAAAGVAKDARPELVVIMGGPHATILPRELMQQDAVDFVVRGEGEFLLRDLVARLAAESKALDDLPGLSHRADGAVRHNPGQGFVSDLDALPLPARDKLDMTIYRPASGAYRRRPVASMITSRGCPFDCSFCSRAVFGNHVRVRSPENVIEEAGALVERYRIREIYFADDCMTLHRARTEELCDRLIRSGLDLTWTCSTRVDLVDEPLLQAMKRAGCVSIGYGIETGHPERLRALRKGTTHDQARRALAWTESAGIETRASFIFGFPGEDRASLEQTLALALELNVDFVIFNLAIPLPGTELYREAHKAGLLLADGPELYPKTDGAHPLIRLDTVTPDELKAFYDRAYRTYYLRPRYLLKRFSRLRSFHDIRLNWRGLKEFLAWQGSRP